MISEKETVISDVVKKLSEIKSEKTENPVIGSIIKNIRSSQSFNTWNEFEIHFKEIHPRFYTALNTKYPTLSANEVKLCAFIKLNLSTKEIAAVTGKNLNTIDVARSRLRKKMGIIGNENLYSIIAGIN